MDWTKLAKNTSYIIKEPTGGAHHNPEQVFKNVLKAIKTYYPDLMKINQDKRIKLKIDKFSKMGVYTK